MAPNGLRPPTLTNELDGGSNLRDLDWAGAFRRALERAVLESERRRMALVAGFFAVCLAVSFFYLVAGAGMSPQFRESFLRSGRAWVSFYVVAITYELTMRGAAGRCLRAGRPWPAWVRYLNAFLEASLPTVAVLTAMRHLSPVHAIFIPPVLFYLVIVLLTTLQLDWRLCVFAGTVAAAEYLVMVVAVARPSPAAAGDPIFADLSQHVARAGVFALGGLAAAFVAGQVRRQLARSVESVQERNRAISIFGQHVSPQVARKLLHQSASVGPETREVCVMFLDIRDFTRYARDRSPAEVMDYLNTVFGSMIDTVNRNHGIINKFLGDGFMAVFGAPVADGESRRHAVNAALEIVRRVEAMKEHPGLPPTRVGIGLHAGSAVTGELGSYERKEYTVIGDVVNLASRIEQLNKQFGSQVLVSEEVAAALPKGSMRVEPVGPVMIKGMDNATVVYRLA